MEEQIVRSLVEEFSGPFQADGGDLVLVSCDKNVAVLQIVIGPETCRECIMGAEDVKEIISGSIESQLGRPMEVVVEVVEKV